MPELRLLGLLRAILHTQTSDIQKLLEGFISPANISHGKMTEIELKGVGKRRDDVWVLKNITCKMEAGEVLVVFGASGSGKSTLLRCINRLIDVDEGQILLDGKLITEIPSPELRRKAGMVFQFPAVFEGSVEENVRYGMDIWGIDAPDMVKQALADANLDESFLERDAMKLSGGEQQRVCLARALAIGSQALLLDEPTSSLDSDSAGTIETTILELKKSKELAIAWVTHDREQAKRVGDRVLVLDNGQIKQIYTAEEFREVKSDG